MRILITTGIFEPESGGPATYTPALASQLTAQGHTVTVITYSNTTQLDTDANYSFTLVRVVRGNKVVNRIRFFFTVLAHARTYDLIYTLDWFAAGLPVALVAKILHKPYAVRVGGDYIWEQRYCGSGANPVTLKDFYERGVYKRYVQGSVFRIIRFVLHGAAHVIFNSDVQRELYHRFYDLSPAQTSTIYNPVPRMETKGIVRDAPNMEIISWGRLVTMKNLDSLIRAFSQAQLPSEYTLTIIGDGPQKELLQKLIDELHLNERVRMLPSMLKHNVLMRVRNARAFVLPSWTDISPNQVYEAIAINLPAIVTTENYLPFREQLPEMINPRSVDDIAEKLTMLADETHYASFVGHFNMIHVERDWDVVAKEHEELFVEVLRQRKS